MYKQHYWIDPYLVANKAAIDAIIAYHTALELHGIAYTTFNDFIFLSKKQTPSFEYEAQIFHGVSYPKQLLRSGNSEYGVEIVEREGMAIKRTSLERTIVDVFRSPRLGRRLGRNISLA